MVKKVITNLDSFKASGTGCVPVVVLQNCEPELSYILKKINFMSSFYGWGSTVSRLQSH